MASIRTLAQQAGLFVPGAGQSLEQYLLQGYRYLVSEVGGCYRQTAEAALTIGENTFALPPDFRELLPDGAWLGYEPRNIASISRTGGVVAVETSTAHLLSSTMHVQIAGVTPTGADAFDTADAEVTVSDSTHFTYAQADYGVDPAGTGGTVESVATRQALSYAAPPKLTREAAWEVSSSTPQYYTILDQVLLLYPTSDGALYPCLYLEYDAQVPAAFTLTSDLALPDTIADGLVDFAVARAQGQKRAEALPILDALAIEWRRTLSRLSNSNEPSAL